MQIGGASSSTSAPVQMGNSHHWSSLSNDKESMRPDVEVWVANCFRGAQMDISAMEVTKIATELLALGA
eukprot:3612868-Heterocapsa_arctica.AAC.1